MMMPIKEFLAFLAQQNIKLWVEDDNLRVNAPKGALTPVLRNQLRARKREILTALRPVTALPTVQPAPEQRFEPFPLTDVQHAYWLGRQSTFELGNVSTHIYMELESPTLDLSRLTQAWQRVIERHEMLRAVVLPSGQQQILHEVPPYEIELLDLTDEALEEPTVDLLLESVREEMSHQIFSTEEWPLFEIRATRFMRSEVRIRLHLSLDLLTIDAWSIDILFGDWARFYQNPNLLLPPLELSYRDYLITEKSLEETGLYQRSREYWLNRLDTLPLAPKLPFAQDPSSISQPRFKRRLALLAAPLWQAIKTRAAKANLRPSNIILAAFAEILTVWSKTPRFTLTLTLFNRLPLHPQVNEIVGDFTTLTLLAVDNSSADTFLARAKRIQEQLWQDLDHRYFSGLRVMRELARQQASSGGALLPIVFTNVLGMGRHDPSRFDSSVEMLFGEEIYSISQTSQVYLDHGISEWEGQLVFNWDTVEGLFPEGMLDEMFEAYRAFLERLATDSTAWTDPYRQLVPLAQLKQREAVNATQAPISDELLHTLFVAQVETHYDDVAVIAPERTLTYGELYAQATQIGHWLRQKGAKPNMLVAVVMEKGWEQVVAVLGILISGAAYLPIDPTWPTERQHYLLEQGEATLALTQSHLEQAVTWPQNTACPLGIQRLSVDTVAPALSWGEGGPIASSQFEPVQTPTDLAYVIYTSGSTGQPKGVVIDHRGAVNTVLDINRRFDVTAEDRVLALSALNFDLSVYDIFGLLAVGGTIVIPQDEGRRDPAHWADLMVKHGVTLWDTVPALMQMLLEYHANRTLKVPLRLVMMSGDWIPLNLPDRIRGLWPDAQLMSLGGATEASIWSIFYPIGEIDPTWKSIPYGKPLTNQTFHVLNHLLEPCPVWVVGELYIGGVGLALGYWRDEKKSNASFITHPRTGTRLYKTGDLGRYLPDGNIEFLGREDFQVKIRGHRIELGEIEANLVKHPGVKEALLALRPKGDKQLVAYVVPALSVDNQPLDQAAESYEATESALTDPGERLAFKLDQRGIRRLEGERVSFKLPQPSVDEAAYLSRQSYRQFLTEPVPLTKFGAWLACLKPHTFADSVFPKYRYGSAGGLYPVQTYLYIKPGRVMGLSGGTYYYHPLKHELILLSTTTRLERTLHADVNQANYEQSAFSLFLVGELAAIEPMYGKMAHNYCLLEAGYMSQLLQEEAPEHEIGLCPIGWLDFAPLREEFELTESQLLLHSFIGGGISLTQMQTLAQPSTTPQTLETEIKTYLAQKLPAYMVPNFYIMLDALPLTANGKVDRKALANPDLADLTRKEIIAPHTETQKRLAAIWEEMLGIKEISITDHFFELGGDSLFSIQLIRRLRDEFLVEVPVRTVFESPNVKALAEYIDALKQAQEMLLAEDDDEDYDEGEL